MIFKKFFSRCLDLKRETKKSLEFHHLFILSDKVKTVSCQA